MYTDNNLSDIPFVSLPKDDTEEFFQELKNLSEPLVRNSLMQYVAYEMKNQEAELYKKDPTADLPFLKQEAALRKMTVGELASAISNKGVALFHIVRSFELLRVEFNERIQGLTTYSEKLALRDELLAKAKALVTSQ